jgi:hypothetical protein
VGTVLAEEITNRLLYQLSYLGSTCDFSIPTENASNRESRVGYQIVDPRAQILNAARKASLSPFSIHFAANRYFDTFHPENHPFSRLLKPFDLDSPSSKA